jgi:hypothetical protein
MEKFKASKIWMSSCFVCSTAEKNEYIREVSNRVVGVD